MQKDTLQGLQTNVGYTCQICGCFLQKNDINKTNWQTKWSKVVDCLPWFHWRVPGEGLRLILAPLVCVYKCLCWSWLLSRFPTLDTALRCVESFRPVKEPWVLPVEEHFRNLRLKRSFALRGSLILTSQERAENETDSYAVFGLLCFTFIIIFPAPSDWLKPQTL